jgi:hypothetical protein
VNCSEIVAKTTENHSKHFSRNFSVGCQFYKNIPEWGSKKAHRNVKIQKQLIQEMADPEIEVKLAPLRAAVKEQVSLINFRGYLELFVEMAQKKMMQTLLDVSNLLSNFYDSYCDVILIDFYSLDFHYNLYFRVISFASLKPMEHPNWMSKRQLLNSKFVRRFSKTRNLH